MSEWNNTMWSYEQVLNGGTGIYYMKDDLLRYSQGVEVLQSKINSSDCQCGVPDGKFGTRTEEAVKKFQAKKGLIADGKAGKETLHVLENKKKVPISTMAAFKERFGKTIKLNADQFGIKASVLGGFLLTESSGSGFLNGKVVIRLENHKFIEYAGAEYNGTYFIYGTPVYTGHKYRKNLSADWINCHKNQNQEYDAFELAKKFNKNAAFLSISMGLGQIMGFNYKSCGYSSAEAMYHSFSVGELEQINGFISFICSNDKLISACRNSNFRDMAKYYNGTGNIEIYAPKLQSNATNYENS